MLRRPCTDENCDNMICAVHSPDIFNRVEARLAELPPEDPADDLLPGSISCGMREEHAA